MAIGVDRRARGIEEPPRRQVSELPEVGAACIRTARHEEEEVAAVGQEGRSRVTPVLWLLEVGCRDRFAAGGRYSINRPARIAGIQDGAVSVPCSSERKYC